MGIGVKILKRRPKIDRRNRIQYMNENRFERVDFTRFVAVLAHYEGVS
jgi:hypothetical protein